VSFKKRKKKFSSKDLTQNLRDASGPSVDASTVHWSLIRNGLIGRVAVKEPFLRKGKGEKAEKVPNDTTAVKRQWMVFLVERM